MRRREIPKVQAGSMADIAFLLLIFFLVTTTIDREEGIIQIMPKKTDQTTYPDRNLDRNVLKVSANYQDDLMVENELMDLAELQTEVKKWYGQPMEAIDHPDYPKRFLVTQDNATGDQLLVVEMIGPYYQLPKRAIIAFQAANGTSYGYYVKIHDQLSTALFELRDEFSKEHFGISVDDLDPKRHPEHERYLKVLDQVYPSKVSEVGVK